MDADTRSRLLGLAVLLLALTHALYWAMRVIQPAMPVGPWNVSLAVAFAIYAALTVCVRLGAWRVASRGPGRILLVSAGCALIGYGSDVLFLLVPSIGPIAGKTALISLVLGSLLFLIGVTRAMLVTGWAVWAGFFSWILGDALVLLLPYVYSASATAYVGNPSVALVSTGVSALLEEVFLIALGVGLAKVPKGVALGGMAARSGETHNLAP